MERLNPWLKQANCLWQRRRRSLVVDYSISSETNNFKMCYGSLEMAGIEWSTKLLISFIQNETKLLKHITNPKDLTVWKKLFIKKKTSSLFSKSHPLLFLLLCKLWKIWVTAIKLRTNFYEIHSSSKASILFQLVGTFYTLKMAMFTLQEQCMAIHSQLSEMCSDDVTIVKNVYSWVWWFTQQFSNTILLYK